MAKAALIIGASGDIGQAITQHLAANGWSLYLHYFQHARPVRKLQTQLIKQYPKQDFFALQADLTKTGQLQQLTSQLFQVDAVVFAAGITYYGLFQKLSASQLEQLWIMHVKAPLLLCQRLSAKLARSGAGRIVFIGSVYGGSGSPLEVAYSTVKGAQSAFVNAYAREVASLGITVNVVAPGAVDTKMNQMFDQQAKTALRQEIPVSRLAQPAEIAYWVGALLKSGASYLTGQTLYVTGGWRR
ncbi:elongation factor P 5-aminopentanone reductase [Loigolactobacillus rennini]|nr:SDR family oxidoreductase [Loigolactobacillus rennini]SFZ87564.1 3-oxoacyl-[acyl-carrier protein] reductase [Loigolactobacillus rennini]